MEMPRGCLSKEWEECWRREKEQRRKVMKEGGEKVVEDDPELRRIVAYNDNKMGLRRRDGEEERKMKKKNSRASGREGKEEEEERWKEKGESSEEEKISTYNQDTYASELFQTFKEFRDSSLLTDLTLSTEDGLSFLVHSPVLAAVSSLVHHSLQHRDAEWEKRGGSVNLNKHRKVSIVLGPGVDRVGLEGVLEFAYTGVIAALNTDNVVQIQTAAEALGAPRVLELCREEEEKMKTEGQKKTEEEKISAAQQIEISLQSLRQLWTQRVGCDVVLELDGTSFHAHRVVLAASSDYFRAMFTNGMKESQQYCVTLPSLVASEFEILIGHSYSGSLSLNWDFVFEVACTSVRLLFEAAFSLCTNFLQQELASHSCLDVASFAKEFGMSDLLDVADDFVLRNFKQVSVTKKFQDLPFEKLFMFLKSPYLCVSSELDVFKAVMSWIEANPMTSPELTRDLLRTIHFPLMTFLDFKEIKKMKIWHDYNGMELFKILLREFWSDPFDSENLYRVYLPTEPLVLVGGSQFSEDMQLHIPSRELWFGNSLRNHIGIVKSVEWRKLGEIPEVARLNHEVLILEGKLYVVGGRKYWHRSDVLSSVWRYDPASNEWQKLADMQEPRCSFSMVAVDGVIYAIGGDFEYEANFDRVERYCPNTDSWSSCQPLDTALSSHSASVLDGQIFISGGLDCDYQCLVSMFLYHPESGTTYLADMIQPRAQHCMETLNGRVYVTGGITTAKTGYLDLLSCEVYDPARDTWSSIAPLTTSHVSPASAVLEGKLYVLGGYYNEDYRESKLVHRYDPSSQRWDNMGNLPGPRIGLGACVLPLPAHLRQIPT